MPTEMRLWRIEEERPVAVARQKLDLESRLETWLRHDITLVSSDLLVIGQQIETDYGGFIDLLAIDPVGNLVILELKRDKTPRDIVAQALDYASWVQDLGPDSIAEIANDFLKPKTLEEAFREKFHTDLPEVLNERHRLYIVASYLDAATERIVKYLSETHHVDVNAATFSYFTASGQEMLGRSLLLDETEVQTRAEGQSKRNPPRSWEELRGLAEHHGVVDLYDKALADLEPLFDAMNRTRTSIACVGEMGEARSKNVIMGIYPEASTPRDGLAIMFFLDRVAQYFSLPEETLRPVLGSPAKNAATYDPNATWFFNAERLPKLLEILKRAKKA